MLPFRDKTRSDPSIPRDRKKLTKPSSKMK